MKNFWLTILALLLFVVIALAAFYLLREIVYQPSTILTSTACAPPCWYGIRPGKTVFTEASNVLQQMEGVDEQSIHTGALYSDEVEELSWSFKPPVRDVFGTVYFENETVKAVSILTVNSLRVGEVFALLGEPELIWHENKPSRYGQPVELYLIYPQEGYLVEALLEMKERSNTVKITENTHVYRVAYFDPAKYQDLLNTRILIRRPPITRKNTPQPWTGFGAFQVKEN